MRLARFRVDAQPQSPGQWGFVDEDRIRVAPASNPLTGALADPEQLRALAGHDLDTVALSDVTLLAPVPCPPQFIGVGLNYRDHAEEVGAAIPERPVTFVFHRSAIIGPGDTIELPSFTTSVDWEAELAIVIGRGGRDIPLDDALQHVAGYTIVNDVSARDVQHEDVQWSRAKSFDTFKPMGPWIVTVDELGDASGLDISLTVNGVSKQRSTTDQLIFTVPFLVSYLSRATTLLPGAIISTGTPGGVGFTRNPPEYLRPGDEVEVTVSRIGTLTNATGVADVVVSAG